MTGEVIPQIRKTGAYGQAVIAEDLDDPVTARRVLLRYVDRVLGLEAERDLLQPKAEALDRISMAEGRFSLTSSAKMLRVQRVDLLAYLTQNRWIYRHPHGGRYHPHHDRVVAGLLELRTVTVSQGHRPDKVVEQTMVTTKGLTRLAELVTHLSHLTP